jgi:hypothetical protein
MAFAVAKWWGVMPHTVWRYPFRYYRELRDYYIAAVSPTADKQELSADGWEAESLTGDPV